MNNPYVNLKDPVTENNTYGLIRYELESVPEQIRVETSSFCNSSCSWCIKPGQLVTSPHWSDASKNEYMPIEEFQGGWVTTHKNHREIAVPVMSRMFRGELVTIKPFGLPVVSVTPDHRVRVVNRRHDYDESWVQARDIQIDKHVLCLPIYGADRSGRTSIESLGREFYEGPVYDLSVERDHSYTVGGIAVHNCSAHGDFKPLTRKKGRMTQALFSHILDDIATWPEPLKRFNPTNFGELFMVRTWFEMLQEVERKLPQTQIVFSTTGSLWTDEHIEKLAQIKNLGWLNFSINAWFSETWEQIHKVNPRLMTRAYQAVHKFRDRRPDVYVTVSMVQDSDITTEVEKDIFREYWSRFGPVTVSAPSYANNPNRVPREPVTLPCRSVVDGLVIFDTGLTSVGCCFSGDAETELLVGKVPEERLLDIWHGDRLKKIVELHNSGRRMELPICKSCSYA